MRDGVAEFNRFLETNYPYQNGTSERTIAYFNDLEIHTVFNPDWSFDRQSSKSILEAYENTGLRKSIYIRGDETEGFDEFVQMVLAEDSIKLNGVSEREQAEMDSLNILENRHALYFNTEGVFKDAVSSCSEYWAKMESYYEVRETALNISPGIIIGGLQNSFEPIDYENPVLQSIIFIEIFEWQMEEDIRRNQ